MHRDRIVRWGDDGPETFFKDRGCWPTSLAEYGQGFVILCHRPNTLVHVDADGKVIARFARDGQGQAFTNPNDCTADGRGGVYFSASGEFSKSAPATGAVLYLDRDGTITRVLTGLHYANGVVFDRAQNRLLVSEHIGGRIISASEPAPGRLGTPKTFIDLSDKAIEPINNYPLTGPDGLELGADGMLYAAVYGAGTLLMIAPDGTIRDRLQWSEPLITSVTLIDNERTLVLTGSQITDFPPARGRVERLANPLYKH